MKEKINIRQALRVFHSITAKGQRQDDGYHLDGLTAFTDFDGYTVTIRNDYVSLNIFFHNKFSFNYANSKEKALFLEKLNVLDKASSTSG